MKTSICLFLLCGAASAVQAADVRTLDFSLCNERDTPVYEVVRVSLPVPAGLIPGKPPQFVSRGAAHGAAQADVITRHPDGSVRRMMLSFPIRLGAQGKIDLTCEPVTATAPASGYPAPGPALARVEGETANIQTDVFDLQFRDHRLHILGKKGGVLGTVLPFGPTLQKHQAPTLTVIENGPLFVWLRWRRDGADYSREVDIQADKLGRVRLVQRMLRHLKDDGQTPDFGFDLSAAGAKPLQLPERPVHFRTLPMGGPLGKHPELVAALSLADGTTLAMANPLALRQHRGTLETSGSAGIATVRFSRIEPVARETENLVLQEGMWRKVEVVFQGGPPEKTVDHTPRSGSRRVVQPGPAERLAAAIDTPLVARVDWRLFDAVYRTGPPLEVYNSVLKALVEKYVAALEHLSVNGDDLGSLGGLERFNNCQYIWEDYFRSGDSRLRRVALDYSENYNNFSIYWGPKQKYYGGGRYPMDQWKLATVPPGGFHTRRNNANCICHKGYQSFWLAYEETGDPRFRYAAEQQAHWADLYVPVRVNRCIGQVIDLVKLYEYSGKRSYLEIATRFWKNFDAEHSPELLYSEGSEPMTGNDLYIYDDAFGVKHPFVKAYIVQYATNSLPYLLACRRDDKRLRDTIVACNDWMAKVQTAAGGWSYPGPTTAGFEWDIEYCHGLMMGYEVEPKEAYLDAVGRTLRAITALYRKYGDIPHEVTPWEYLAGKSPADLGRIYRLGSDRDRKRDFADGRIDFGVVKAEFTVYFQVLLRDYLRHRPESSLFTRDKTLDQILQMRSSLPPAVAPSPKSSGRNPQNHPNR